MGKQVVELDGQAVGILIPRDGQLLFLAVKFEVWDLDGRLFPHVAAATSAARAMGSASGQGSTTKHMASRFNRPDRPHKPHPQTEVASR